MDVTNTFDEAAYYDRKLVRIERELAAVVRQYGRAAEASDDAAKEVEADALADRIKCLLYNHLGLRIGMASNDWVWLQGHEDCLVEVAGMETRISGRIWCCLPEARREWTEPFAAEIGHPPTAESLDYTIWLGNRTTLLDLAKVREIFALGEKLSSPAPDEWAFVFRKGDRT